MKPKRVIFYLTLFVFLIANLASVQKINALTCPENKDPGQNKLFKAGAAITNISPSLGGGSDGSWSSPRFTVINDELNARCLVLDDGKTRLVFVVLDLIGFGHTLADEAKRMIEERTNIPKENVIISATHTHSCIRPHIGNPPFTDYQIFILNRIADAVQIALNNLEPARIGWGVGSVPEHLFVRRWKMKTPVPNPFGGYDIVRMNPGQNNPNLLEPAGVPDPEVTIISVQSINGRPIALFANYSLHYVSIGPGASVNEVSAGYFAAFADRIQELLGADRQNPPFVGIMSNGTSGDVTSTDFSRPARRYGPYEKMREVADDVAREVQRVYKSIHHHDWVSLQATQDKLKLQVRKPDKPLIDWAEGILAKPETAPRFHPSERDYANRTLRLLEWPDYIDIVLQAFRIGDLAIATSPFETFAETGLEIKARSPFKPTFTISFAHGHYGYLPTPEQHELGGYETWLGANRVEMEASNKLVLKLIEMFERLK